MKICNNCVLTERFPGISFDQNGICNFCSAYKSQPEKIDARKVYHDKFVALTKTQRNREGYDVLMAYSGGKDSTYTLELFVNHFGLKVLALTFDNAFISERSFINMNIVTEVLGVDHQIIRPNPVVLGKIFNAAAHRDLYSPKAMERASSICTSCIGLVKAVMLRTALEKKIPFIGFGWSPGQAPLQASVMQTNPALLKMTQKAIFEPLSTIVGGEALTQYFVTEEQYSDAENWPWNIHPLAFLDYNEEKILLRNRQLGWEKPLDTDANSTNCTLNAYANKIHMDRYGFHPYVCEIANMVRAGAMTRDEGLAKFIAGESQELIDYAQKKLEAYQ